MSEQTVDPDIQAKILKVLQVKNGKMVQAQRKVYPELWAALVENNDVGYLWDSLDRMLLKEYNFVDRYRLRVIIDEYWSGLQFVVEPREEGVYLLDGPKAGAWVPVTAATWPTLRLPVYGGGSVTYRLHRLTPLRTVLVGVFEYPVYFPSWVAVE